MDRQAQWTALRASPLGKKASQQGLPLDAFRLMGRENIDLLDTCWRDDERGAGSVRQQAELAWIPKAGKGPGPPSHFRDISLIDGVANVDANP